MLRYRRRTCIHEINVMTPRLENLKMLLVKFLSRRKFALRLTEKHAGRHTLLFETHTKLTKIRFLDSIGGGIRLGTTFNLCIFSSDRRSIYIIFHQFLVPRLIVSQANFKNNGANAFVYAIPITIALFRRSRISAQNQRTFYKCYNTNAR
jgi:hypothetical protein